MLASLSAYHSQKKNTLTITTTSHTMTNWFSGMIETVAMCKQLCFGGSVLGLFMKAILIVTIQKQIPRVGGLGAS